MMLNIILFGAPGAGKGTQSKKLSERYDLKHISTGEVIRREIQRGTEVGTYIEDHIAHGELAPDEMMIKMIANYIKGNNNNGNIFDGFPRTTVQAEAFDQMMEENETPVDVMISLEVPQDELIARLLNRGENSGRPEDVDKEVICNRLDIYRTTTKMVSEHYRKQDKFIEIDGIGEIDDVFDRICTALQEHLKERGKVKKGILHI